MKTIIVPTDFSDCAENAVKTATQLAKMHQSELILVHIINTMEFYVPIEPMTGVSMYSPETLSPFFNEHMAEAKLKLKKMTEALIQEGIQASYRVNFGPLIEEIKNIEAEKDCHLIVMGTKGSSGLEEVFIGSNTQRVVRFSKKPVLAVKDFLDFSKAGKAVFVSDFDEEVLGALNKTLNILNPTSFETEALFINTPHYFEDSISSEEKIKHVLKQSSKPEIDMHIHNDFTVEEGVSAFAIKHQISLIAITTHGYTGLRKLFNANITESIVNHIDLPVLSIPFEIE